MARAQVREVSAPSAIQGIASPVNTYVRPADPGRNSLADLAEGLSAFDKGLGAFLQKRKAEQDEQDYQRGLAESYRENGPAWEEGVRQGLIPANKSPRFMEGLEVGQGNLAGIRLRSKFHDAYLQWDGRNKGDDKAYAAFLTTFIKDNVPEDSRPNFLKGLNPHLNTITEEGYSQFYKDSSSAAYNAGLNTDAASLTETIRTYDQDGQTSPSGTDYDTLWTHALGIRDEAMRRGTLAADIDSTLVDTIILNAVRTKDDKLLALLDRTLPGQDHPMSYGLDIQKKRDAAAERIANLEAKDQVDTAKAREDADKKRAGQAYAEIATIWSKDIRAEIPEDFIEDLSKLDPMARSKLADLRKKLSDADGVEDKAAIARIFADIHEGNATKQDILQQFYNGTIRSTETLNQALDRVDRVDKDRKDGTGLLTDATVKKWHGLFEKLTTEDKLTNPWGTSGPSDEGMEAIHDFNAALLDWEDKHPDASFMERQEAIDGIGKSIRGRIQLDGDMTSGGHYDSDADRAARAAQGDSEEDTQKSTIPEQSAPPAAPPHEEGGWLDTIPNPIESGRNLLRELFGDHPEEDKKAAAAPDLETLPQDQRDTVDAIAKAHGVDPATVNRDIWKRAQELVKHREATPDEEDTGIDQTTTNSISEDTRNRLTALFSNPPKLPDDAQSRIPVAPILNLIGNTEGTDKGDGYNETLGYGAYTGGDVDLVNMTLGDVDKLQTQMLRHPDNRWNSSAVGRYQVIRTTLRDVKKEMGLTDDMKFDKELQDRIAMHLLERRGLSKWQAGEMSDSQFLTSLSQEWASLPSSTGKGFYKGQRAAATTRQVLASLHGGPPGHTSALLPSQQPHPEGTPAAYAKIPDLDGNGKAGQVAKFIEWNSDPVANNAANLKALNPTLADVVRRAQKISGVHFVIGSGKRDAALQKKAVEWGWSKTEDSDHLDGNAVDLWPLDGDGAVNFDGKSQAAIVKAMKQAAKQLGVSLDIGAEWKRFKDRPHFAIKSGRDSA